MDSFTGAWTTFETVPTMTETCEEDFTLPSQYADSALGFQEDEWGPFLKTLGHDTSNARSTFELAESTKPESFRAPAPLTELPLMTPGSSARSSGSSLITPPNSATEPVLTFNAPVTSHPQIPSTLWTYSPYRHGSHFGNLGPAGLGIQFPNPTGGNFIHSTSQTGHSFDRQMDQPVASIEREHPRFREYENQQTSHYGDPIDNDDDSEAEGSDPCYAKLLYACLKEAPGHTLSLKDLYEWVAQSSQKAKDPKTRGWQNSVRHNLSMNAAFERVTSSANQGGKKGSLWRLTDDAIRNGVISTTRYRKDPKRKPERRGHPQPKRQISGARGGQATRAASRRHHGIQNYRPMPYLSLADQHVRSQYARHEPTMSPYSPHFASHSPQLLMTPLSPPSPYHLGIEEDTILPTLPGTTPPQLAFSYGEDVKPAISNFALPTYDLPNTFLFRAPDEIVPGTPSMGTEASFMAEDCVPELLSRHMSRESSQY